MPANIASTPPDKPIKEVIGSGPFKFAGDEWQPGEQAIYTRNPDYIPRPEPPSGSTGGKKANLDKIIWRYIADPFEAAQALVTGEMDWWQEPPLDFFPKLRSNPEPARSTRCARLAEAKLASSALPFNNKKARQALLHMVDQETYLAWSIGQQENYRTCYSVYLCASHYATRVGAEPMMKHDLATARQLVKESGYDGYPVVVLQTTDKTFLNAAAVVTRNRLESIGFKVILKQADWSSSLIVRARTEAPDKGGWNLLHTWWLAADLANPAVHAGLSGAGSVAYPGWPNVPELEQLVIRWVRATDQGTREQLAEQIQMLALNEVTYVPWGEWDYPTVFRKSVRGVLQFVAPVFWNVMKA
jgi:peptide/nickel transport system substrate-binding protein